MWINGQRQRHDRRQWTTQTRLIQNGSRLGYYGLIWKRREEKKQESSKAGAADAQSRCDVDILGEAGSNWSVFNETSLRTVPLNICMLSNGAVLCYTVPEVCYCSWGTKRLAVLVGFLKNWVWKSFGIFAVWTIWCQLFVNWGFKLKSPSFSVSRNSFLCMCVSENKIGIGIEKKKNSHEKKQNTKHCVKNHQIF